MKLKASIIEKRKGSRTKVVGATTFLTLFLIVCPTFIVLNTIESQRQDRGGTLYSSLKEKTGTRSLVRFSLNNATIKNVTHPMVTSRKSIVENSDSMSPK